MPQNEWYLLTFIEIYCVLSIHYFLSFVARANLYPHVVMHFYFGSSSMSCNFFRLSTREDEYFIPLAQNKCEHKCGALKCLLNCDISINASAIMTPKKREKKNSTTLSNHQRCWTARNKNI